ncbi:flagella basal body P-ring formation protein FlgA, partial [Helicobacter suis]
FIAPHTILSIDRVGPKILIYKHEIFSATLKEGPLFLETSLQALENGVLNQVIQALNVRSKKVVQVKITGLLKGEVL